jgi:AcrR family transcriptional regulator
MKRTKRRYVLRMRGDQVAETRARIVEAIMGLHGEVGPRNTTVSAIADRAGVERLTVYRHFKGEAEMFAACSGRYLELNPPPDPTTWAGERDPMRRTQRGLADLYAFFSRTAPMFAKIYLDVDEYPSLKKIMDQFDAHLRHLADDVASAWPRDKSMPKRQTILRHATKFATWQSFEAEGVDNQEKIKFMIGWLHS